MECSRLATKKLRQTKREESCRNAGSTIGGFSSTNWPAGFYTYAYLRDDGRPYYIGKGKEGRAWALHGSPRKRWQPPLNGRILILKHSISEEAAHCHEIYLIHLYKSFGWLTMNFTNGGEGTSGYEYTDELREQRAEQLRGNNYGSRVEWTPELRARLSQLMRGRKMPVTQALLNAREALHIRHQWRHIEHGKRFASCSEMAQETGHHQSNFWRCRAGIMSQTHGWICLNPLQQFEPVEVDHVTRINKAAATRVAKNASAMNMTLAQYNQLSYARRSSLRKLENPLEVAIEKGWLPSPD